MGWWVDLPSLIMGTMAITLRVSAVSPSLSITPTGLLPNQPLIAIKALRNPVFLLTQAPSRLRRLQHKRVRNGLASDVDFGFQFRNLRVDFRQFLFADGFKLRRFGPGGW